MTPRAAALLGALLLPACVPDHGPTMEPGEDCNECHGWTVAGTVFRGEEAPADAGVRGARVHLVDAGGRRVTLRTNAAGNFYLADRLAFPLEVAVEWNGSLERMEPLVHEGSCNGCHGLPPREGAPGRIAAE